MTFAWFGGAAEAEELSGGPLAGTANPATETDAAQSLGRQKSKAVTTATEADAAQALARRKSRALGISAESDAAQPVGKAKVKTVGVTAETDSPQPLTRRKSKALTAASETDTATTWGRIKSRVLGVATETGAAQAFGRVKRKTVGVATEADEAQPIGASLGGEISEPINPATETDVALPVGRVKRRTVGVATEADTPSVLGRIKAKLLAVASETDVARALSARKSRAVGTSTETDLAMPFTAGPVFVPDYANPYVTATLPARRVTLATVNVRTLITLPTTEVSVTMPNDLEPMYVGDLLPQLRIDATVDGGAVDFTAASSCVINGRIGDTVIIDGRPVTSSDLGFVLMDWQAADTDTEGYLELEVVATYAGKDQTFRARAGVNIIPRIA